MAFLAEPIPENTAQETQKVDNAGNWGNLSELFKARIRLCSREGEPLGTEQVVAMLVDGDFSLENQFSTPFENSNPEQKLPTLMGMLQDGAWVTTLGTGLSSLFGVDLADTTAETLNTLQGRSNFTKVNSTNIYVSSNPVTMTVTLYFGAWENAKIEVEDQLKLLQEWSAPVKLADGSILNEIMQDKSLLSFFPSEIPPFVSLTHGGKTYSPFFIQSVSKPLDVPMDSDGNTMAVSVQVTLISRTAWDKGDITKLYGGK